MKEIYNYFIGRQTAKFRISDHSLTIEKGRHHGILNEDRICKQCDTGCVEDEFHFLFVCPKYKDLREQYLPKYHTNNPNLRKFVDILHSNNGEMLRNLLIQCCLDLGISFSGLGCICRDLGNWGVRVQLGFPDMWAWSVGVLDTEARLYYGGLLTSIGNPIRLSRL